MSAEDSKINISHQPVAWKSKPDTTSQPENVHPATAGPTSNQPGKNLVKTLSNINEKMSIMASLLQTIVDPRTLMPQKKQCHSYHKILNANSISGNNGQQMSSNQRHQDDALSLSPLGEDINKLLEGSTSNPREIEAPGKTTEPEEVKLLKSLEADFTDENVGAKINQSLAKIASKHWDIILPNNKL